MSALTAITHKDGYACNHQLADKNSLYRPWGFVVRVCVEPFFFQLINQVQNVSSLRKCSVTTPDFLPKM